MQSCTYSFASKTPTEENSDSDIKIFDRGTSGGDRWLLIDNYSTTSDFTPDPKFANINVNECRTDHYYILCEVHEALTVLVHALGGKVFDIRFNHFDISIDITYKQESISFKGSYDHIQQLMKEIGQSLHIDNMQTKIIQSWTESIVKVYDCECIQLLYTPGGSYDFRCIIQYGNTSASAIGTIRMIHSYKSNIIEACKKLVRDELIRKELKETKSIRHDTSKYDFLDI